MRDQKPIVVVETDEVPIEEPVRRRRERDAVLDDVGAALGYAPDVRSLSLRLAATVHHPQPGNGAAIVVGSEDVSAERRITNFAIDQQLDDAPLTRRGLDQRLGTRVEMVGIELQANRGFRRQGVGQAPVDDRREVIAIQGPNGSVLPATAGLSNSRSIRSRKRPSTSRYATGRSNSRKSSIRA